MSFFAILCALLLEQVRPLAQNNPVHALARSCSRGVCRNFDAGKEHHGWLAWALAVVLPALVVGAVFWLLRETVGGWAAVLWNIGVLYCTLGFRQFSHHFTAIRDALQEGDQAQAREALAQWQQVDASELPRSEIVRHVIEYSVLAAHRHVFGVLTWFCLFSLIGVGVAGPVLYRLSEFARRDWPSLDATGLPRASDALQRTAQLAWTVVDWLPARLTALSFAAVGNFEDAIEGWRYHAQRFAGDNDGIILAATAGAINIQLGGEPLKPAAREQDFPEQTLNSVAAPSSANSTITPGRTPQSQHLAQVVGLVWRTVVVWMGMLFLLTLAQILG